MLFKPCPFCGTDHPDNPKDKPAFPGIRVVNGKRELLGWLVRCGHPGCGAEVCDETPELALARWNKRV